MEQFDVYDNNRVKTGLVLDRGTKLQENQCRLVVHVCIFDEQNQMLIQQRQPFKKGWPNLWDITLSGHSLTGETSQQSAAREMREELGLNYDFADIRPYFTINFKNGFDDFYFLKAEEIDMSTLKLQEEEVQAVKWATKEDIEKLFDEGKFVPYIKSLILSLFDMKEMYGIVIN
ncbi:MAG: NUDIX domain-containing protein [Clostridia bacterium]|nr:NUDIX domain-containing protein [Clostridia bacterium]